MKNNLLLFAIAAAAMASCSKTETVDQPTAGAIAFDRAYIGNPVQSKSVIDMTLAKLETDGFIVYGGYDNEGTYVPVFDNTKVSKSGESWGYGTDLKYWIPNKHYQFSAFAPEDAVTSPTTSDGFLTFSYTSDLNGNTEQKDLIYAAHTQTGARTGNENIQFRFKHLLSMIKFSFTTDMAAGVNVSVSDLTISGVNTTATFTGNGKTDATSFGGSWSAATGAQGEVAIPGIVNDASITVTAGQETIPFVVIPQTIGTVTVKFKVSANGNGVDIQNKEISATIPTGDWEMGHRYNYSATISGDKLDLEPIVFGEPTVDVWNDDSWDTAILTTVQ